MVRWFVAALAFASVNASAEASRVFVCEEGSALACEPAAERDVVALQTCTTEHQPENLRPVIIRTGWIHDAILKPRTETLEQTDPLGSDFGRPQPRAGLQHTDPLGSEIPRPIVTTGLENSDTLGAELPRGLTRASGGDTCALVVPQSLSAACGEDGVVVLRGGQVSCASEGTGI